MFRFQVISFTPASKKKAKLPIAVFGNKSIAYIFIMCTQIYNKYGHVVSYADFFGHLLCRLFRETSDIIRTSVTTRPVVYQPMFRSCINSWICLVDSHKIEGEGRTTKLYPKIHTC
jgi:hypothetical protein